MLINQSTTKVKFLNEFVQFRLMKRNLDNLDDFVADHEFAFVGGQNKFSVER